MACAPRPEPMTADLSGAVGSTSESQKAWSSCRSSCSVHGSALPLLRSHVERYWLIAAEISSSVPAESSTTSPRRYVRAFSAAARLLSSGSVHSITAMRTGSGLSCAAVTFQMASTTRDGMRSCRHFLSRWECFLHASVLRILLRLPRAIR